MTNNIVDVRVFIKEYVNGQATGRTWRGTTGSHVLKQYEYESESEQIRRVIEFYADEISINLLRNGRNTFTGIEYHDELEYIVVESRSASIGEALAADLTRRYGKPVKLGDVGEAALEFERARKAELHPWE